MSGTFERMPLSVAAQRLGISWARAWRLVLSGELEGDRRGGRWWISAASVERYLGATVERRRLESRE